MCLKTKVRQAFSRLKEESEEVQSMINEETKKDILPRLKKIEGQIRGIQGMIEKERYCIDILNQVTAAQRALDQVNLKVMQRHIESCVTDAIRSNGSGPIVGELMETIYKFIR
jgi:DNA-binding FrmR family transcriptional regulator